MTGAEIAQALDLMRARVASSSVAAVARELDYSRPAVSMALSGRYLGRLDRLARRALERLGGVICPHLGRPIPATECADHRRRPMPSGSARSFRHWQACRHCPHNPDPEGEAPNHVER